MPAVKQMPHIKKKVIKAAKNTEVASYESLSELLVFASVTYRRQWKGKICKCAADLDWNQLLSN